MYKEHGRGSISDLVFVRPDGLPDVIIGNGVKEIPVPVGVEIQQKATGHKDPVSFGVCCFRMGEIPGKIPRHDHIKGSLCKSKIFSVHLHKPDGTVRRAGEGAGIFFGFSEHGRFGAGTDPEDPPHIGEQEDHPLRDYVRPDYDIGILRSIGFEDISIDRDITGMLWDDKEKLLYATTPMFEICAAK